MEKKYQLADIVQETLLIPLYMRAMESRRTKDNILKDDMAERLTEQIDYDYNKLNKAKMSYVGCVVRGRYYDDATRRFILTHHAPVVVNVGCGLDTRRQRIKESSKATFYELDLPEVMELRRKLIPEEDGDHYLTASLLDDDWMDELRSRHPSSDFLIIAEGVMMYFYEQQVKEFVTRIASRFGGGELYLDVCGPMMSKRGVKPDSLRDSQVEIRSGFEDGHVFEQWAPNLRLIEQCSYMSFFCRRWGLMGYTVGLFPKLCFRFSSLLKFEII